MPGGQLAVLFDDAPAWPSADSDDLAVRSVTYWIPPRLRLVTVARRDPRRCLACGHGMAVHAAGRCLCEGRPGGEVPAPAVPVVRGAAGVVVGVPALAAGPGSLLEDLRAAAAVRAVPGDARAAAGVRAGVAAGRGRDDRRGDRPGGRRGVRGAPRRRSSRGARHESAP